jgi:hypothetical protein
MKQIVPAYTYDKTTGVIILTGVNIDRDQLLLIVNTTRNVTYYNFADSTTTLQAFTQGVDTSVTLNSSIISASSAHTNGDALTIYYDDQVTANEGGETPTSGTATLTNDTRWELNTEGFGHIAFEVVSTGASWGNNGVAAQAYNGTAPSNPEVFAPAGIRYRHSNDTSVSPVWALNNIYFNLGVGPLVGNGYGTNLTRVDGSNSGSLALPTTGIRYFLFDLTTSRFALRPFFTAGAVVVNYRLYRGKHPFFSARNVIVSGDASGGAVSVSGAVNIDGGYIDGVGVSGLPSLQIDPNDSINGPVVEADSNVGSGPRYMVVVGGFDNGTEFRALTLSAGALIVKRKAADFPTVTTFTSITSATLVVGNAGRRMLTIQNTGPGILYLLFFAGMGSGVASATNFCVKLDSGVFYENDYYSGQVNAVFATAGTARVTSLE